MRVLIAILVALTVGVDLHGQELQLLCRLDIPKAPKQIQFDSNRYYTDWISEDEIISFSRDLRLVRTNVTNQEEAWAKKLESGVNEIEVSRTQNRVAIITDEHEIVVFDTNDGTTLHSIRSDSLADKIGIDSCLPTEIAIHPKDGRLLVVDFSRYFGSNAHLLSSEFNTVDKTVDVDAMPRHISFSIDGDSLVTIGACDVLNVRNVAKNSDTFFTGKRFKKPNKSFSVPIDAPFYSNVFFDGKTTLAFARDNSWSTGKITIQQLGTDNKTTFDALNGHIVMDVEFEKKWILVSGTSTNAYLFKFDGSKIAQLDNANHGRNFGIKFSPSGNRFLVFNRDSTSVFNIKTK